MITTSGRTGDEAGSQSRKRKGPRYSRLRLSALLGAFLVILINPFINFYFHNNFVQGWYQSLGIGKLWFVSPLEGLESFLLTREVYMASLVGILVPVILATLLGRVFCSWICPVTFILELIDRFRKWISGKKYLRNSLIFARQVLWYTLLAELLVSMVLGAPLFVFLSPPGLVGREIMMLVFFHKMAIEGVVLLLVLGLELVTRRCFCRSFCPLGGLLALLGKKRRLKVMPLPDHCVSCGKCEKTCPMGLNPRLGEGMSAYCWNCGDCLDACRTGALAFRWLEK